MSKLMNPKKLSKDEREQLSDALQECRDRDCGASWRNGSHFILIHLLGLFGYSANGSQQAEDTAEQLLSKE